MQITVYIGRGSKWGNPFVPVRGAKRSRYKVIPAVDPLQSYEDYVRNTTLWSHLPELAGQVLGCFCVTLAETPPATRDDEQCHGHVLVRLLAEVSR